MEQVLVAYDIFNLISTLTSDPIYIFENMFQTSDVYVYMKVNPHDLKMGSWQ